MLRSVKLITHSHRTIIPLQPNVCRGTIYYLLFTKVFPIKFGASDLPIKATKTIIVNK